MTIGITLVTDDAILMGADCAVFGHQTYQMKKIRSRAYEQGCSDEQYEMLQERFPHRTITRLPDSGVITSSAGSWDDDIGTPFPEYLHWSAKRYSEIAFTLLDSAFLSETKSILLAKVDNLRNLGNTDQADEVENMVGLKNVVAYTTPGLQEHLFVAYSEARLPEAGVIQQGTCTPVNTHYSIGFGKNRTQPFLEQEYRAGLPFAEGLDLLCDALQLCLDDAEQFKGYSVAVIPKEPSTDIKRCGSLDATSISADDVLAALSS